MKGGQESSKFPFTLTLVFETFPYDEHIHDKTFLFMFEKKDGFLEYEWFFTIIYWSFHNTGRVVVYINEREFCV